MNRRLMTVAAMSAAVLCATPVFAEGFYVGGGIGNTFYGTEVADAANELKSIDENATSWKLFGGFSPKKFLGLEGGYRHFGTAKFGVDNINYEASTKGWDIEALGLLRIAVVDVFGKAGLMFWNSDGKVGDREIDGDSGTDFLWGLGAGVHLGPFGVRAEWESVEVGGPDSASMVSLSATFGF